MKKHGLILMKQWDGLDNRRTIYDCFVRMGRNLPEDLAASRRAGFLQGVSDIATGPFRRWFIEGSPTVQEAYDLFLQITAFAGVDIDSAAKLLEKAVRLLEKQERGSRLPEGWARR